MEVEKTDPAAVSSDVESSNPFADLVIARCVALTLVTLCVVAGWMALPVLAALSLGAIMLAWMEIQSARSFRASVPVDGVLA